MHERTKRNAPFVQRASGRFQRGEDVPGGVLGLRSWRRSSVKRSERRGESVESTTERIAVTRELVIDASPETVWEFLTDPGEDQALEGRAGVVRRDARRGVPDRGDPVAHRRRRGRRARPAAPARLHVGLGAWAAPCRPARPPSSTSSCRKATARACIFTHRDLPNQEAADSHATGWDHYLERLAVASAGGDPGPDPWLTERME